eukprot:CAMPEP_0198205888 /NCGR_PEP_ID=MMETSP1445-20131203/9425_1 /TAXON_ID=36898 /ORGANISM="Pyramimonas sp., Strain CCMP2087" /LENGTH=70 /DNA_ID=CAMNT_0043878367 /DNA_START=291 /DNA_END=503 /DNA_ORIENTATION=-
MRVARTSGGLDYAPSAESVRATGNIKAWCAEGSPGAGTGFAATGAITSSSSVSAESAAKTRYYNGTTIGS